MQSEKRKESLLLKIPFLGGAIRKYLRQHEIRRDYEFLPATLEVLDRPPAPFSRVTLLLLLVLAAIIFVWASISTMDIVVSANGVVIPKGKIKVIQPLEPGRVASIYVRDGQLVKKGELLISMDNRQNLNDIESIQSELLKTKITISRLQAQLNEDPAAFQQPENVDYGIFDVQQKLLKQSIAAHHEKLTSLNLEIARCRAERVVNQASVSRLRKSLPLSEKLYEKKSALAERKLISNVELLQAEIEINNAKHDLLTAESRLEEVEVRLNRAIEEKLVVTSEYSREILSKLETENGKKESLSHQLAKAEGKESNTSLYAPVDGIVQQLAVNTIGGVVTSAQALMVIVPIDSGLEIEAKVQNKDIGFITKDQRVSVKATPFTFTRYGDLQGKIEWVATDAVMDEQLGPIYPIRVSVEKYELPNLVNGRKGVITPGMLITADIKVGSRRVIDYFIGPVLRYRDTSLREI